MGKKTSARKRRSHVKQKPTVSPTPDKGTYVQRTHKDTLFRYLFRDKKKLLQLYNALNGSSYQDTDKLIITTLENVIYLGYKNDISFLLDSMLCLFEHQGSWNPNMPLRGLLYFSRLYQDFIDSGGYNLYGSRLISLPFPQYVVFYNGTKERPEREILTLSDAFRMPAASYGAKLTPALECTALVLNINYGKNQELMEKCRPLLDYSRFIFYIRQKLAEGYSPESSVDLAVERCLKEDILTDALRAHRKEVTSMFLEDFDAEFHERSIRAESFEDGFENGFENGKENSRSRINTLNQKLLKDNRSDDLLRSTTDRDFQERLLKEYGI